jgi:hypothetical protein
MVKFTFLQDERSIFLPANADFVIKELKEIPNIIETLQQQ